MPDIFTKTVTCAGEQLILTNQRALYWERNDMLVIADMHLGKTGHFRKHGIPIPSTVMLHDLERLSQLLHFFGAKTLLVVGDMFHARHNRDHDLFADWRTQFPYLDIHLVKGNHDRLHPPELERLGIRAASEGLQVHPFHFVHDIMEFTGEGFTISGHLHPGRVLYGQARQAIRLPSYIVSARGLILPAFSLFTGLDTSHKGDEDTVYYLITDNGLFPVSPDT